MGWFTVIFFSTILVALLFLWRMWTRRRWDQRLGLSRLWLLALPWLPLGLTMWYHWWAPSEIQMFRFFISIAGLFAVVASGINVYWTLWTVLLRFQDRYLLSAGRLLVNISLVMVVAITALVGLFALAYSITSFIFADGFSNHIFHLNSGKPVGFLEWDEFFYFSASTYFSLGYGDYIPHGTLMLGLVYLEALLGYINSGILIAFAFNLFTRLSSNWGFFPKKRMGNRFKHPKPRIFR